MDELLLSMGLVEGAIVTAGEVVWGICARESCGNGIKKWVRGALRNC